MAADFRIDARGLHEVERGVAQLVARFGNVQPLMEAFGQVLETSTIERFDEETAPSGERWLPSMRAEEEGGQTLTDTGGLRLSIRYIAGPSQVEIGSNKIYAKIHNDGGMIVARGRGLAFTLPGLGFRVVKSVRMPQRQYLGLSAADREELLAQVADYASTALPVQR